MLGAFVRSAALGAPANAAPPIVYELDLRQPESHLVQVTMTIPEALAGAEIQFPTWYALYQIRDFIKDVQELSAQCDGRQVNLAVVDINTRQSAGRCSTLRVHYAVYANAEPPFSSVLNADHAFFNPAMLLFYLPHERGRGVQVKLDVPAGWQVATLLDDGPAPGEYQAANYDQLADSPIEAGTFKEYSYTQNAATYRVVVDANPSGYSPDRLLGSLEKITATETALMGDVPFSRYTFIFHFGPHGGGGMEHANGTAITVSNERLRTHLDAVESVAAHEFFHVWNVKRIRPRGLEPIDYIHGNDTRDLWFSEGVTSTYGELALVRAGLISHRDFYDSVAEEIHNLEERPARKLQSAEESGAEAWLEKYPEYFRPERSISYYNKGELLGFLLDLAMRHATRNRHGLDDVMRSLNRNFAQRQRFFTDQDLEATIGELAPGFSGLDTFFRDDVRGTADLDYDTFLAYAGLTRTTATAERPALGFRSLRSFDGSIRVDAVEPGSDAERAGLERGDILVEMNGHALSGLPEDRLEGKKPGQGLKFHIRRGDKFLDLKLNLGSRSETVTRIVEAPNPTPEQLAVREGWLDGVTQE
ncbi:MAG TPA: PDZ domain-containing protein [Terriglobia bacterium]|nr:PDZ domain-containing protein [Terriglobia bacterium]